MPYWKLHITGSRFLWMQILAMIEQCLCLHFVSLSLGSLSWHWSCLLAPCRDTGPVFGLLVVTLVLSLGSLSWHWSCLWAPCRDTGPLFGLLVVTLVLSLGSLSWHWSCLRAPCRDTGPVFLSLDSCQLIQSKTVRWTLCLRFFSFFFNSVSETGSHYIWKLSVINVR